MTSLYEALKRFQDITKAIIHDLRGEEVDRLIDLLNERQQIIDAISNLKYSSMEFSLICEELCIMDLDKEATLLIKGNMNLVQNEIKKVQQAKNANYDYNSVFYKNIKLFDKQV
ncbi:chorismate mutase [Clostridium punense]|uniref:Flagellar protein FliT n=1 Tax=Clostridium punense TaxID=1054297 RepID=A0ABS4K222_9CLOT|nr:MULTISPECIES: flagellar protein FliT [Clostridium]EQB88548.1 hypothetical protein M918_03900 [Clostridium sp. BL8]MBP2021828.1 chorismate mutase [Clostridium punense]